MNSFIFIFHARKQDVTHIDTHTYTHARTHIKRNITMFAKIPTSDIAVARYLVRGRKRVNEPRKCATGPRNSKGRPKSFFFLSNARQCNRVTCVDKCHTRTRKWKRYLSRFSSVHVGESNFVSGSRHSKHSDSRTSEFAVRLCVCTPGCVRLAPYDATLTYTTDWLKNNANARGPILFPSSFSFFSFRKLNVFLRYNGGKGGLHR